MAEQMFAVTEDQATELARLMDAVDARVSSKENRACDVSRSKQLTVGEHAVQLYQMVDSMLPATDEGEAAPALLSPSPLDQILSGAWFHAKLNRANTTSLWMESDAWIEDARGSWHFPLKETPTSDIANWKLVDPDTMSIVEPHDPDYAKKWDDIVNWALGELDTGSEVTVAEILRYYEILQGHLRKTAPAPVDGYGITEVARYHTLRADPNSIDPMLPEARINIEKLDGDDYNILTLNVTPTAAQLIDWQKSGEAARDIAPLNPYDYEPTLVRAVTELVLTATLDY